MAAVFQGSPNLEKHTVNVELGAIVSLNQEFTFPIKFKTPVDEQQQMVVNAR